MKKHLYELDERFDCLHCAGQVLKPPLKIVMVLRGLPDSYDGLVSALESRKDEDLTMEIIKQKLLDRLTAQKEALGKFLFRHRRKRIEVDSKATGADSLFLLSEARTFPAKLSSIPEAVRRR